MRTLENYDPEILSKFLQANDMPWIKYERGKIVLVVDNHLLSTYRSCADFFMLAHVRGKFPKGLPGQPTRSWFLEFGIVFHVLLEHYYKHFRDKDFSVTEWAGELATQVWTAKNMNAFEGHHPEFKTLGGLPGFKALLLAYAHKFTAENEKLRIIGTEVAFGKNKEIPIYIGPTVEIYLAGRIDVIVDDGYFIMPMDHKTLGNFKRHDPQERYIIDEAPTGYVYTLKQILPKLAPPELILKRDCNRILMNYIAKQFDQNAPLDRFKRLAMHKTENQIQRYLQRTVATVEDLLVDLERFFSGVPVKRDTSHCLDWFHGKCPYFDVHRQASQEGEEATLGNGFVTLPIWDTETVNTLN